MITLWCCVADAEPFMIASRPRPFDRGLQEQLIEIRILIILNGVWSSPGALRPAPSC